MRQQLETLISQLGMKRLALMGGVALALLAALAAVALNGSEPDMGYLYTDLDPSAAEAVAQKLSADNIPYRLSADGSSILAPQDKLAEARMAMATAGLGGPIGYEVLDGEQPFGMTAERSRLNQTRAVEGELSKSIETLALVTGARVHLVMPERSVFGTDQRRARASVTVKTRGRLPGETVEAIRHLVASAVPELSPEEISIIDQSGRLLARAGEGGAGGGSLDERQAAIEERLRQEIETLLAPILGEGRVRAEVAVRLDRDQTREESRTFDPDGQVIARQVTVESGDQSDETRSAPTGATVGAQLPEAQAAPAAPGGPSSRRASNETSEDISYANSQTDRVVQKAPGAISRLTVAVMVDAKPKAPSAAEVQRLTRLVENAVGFDPERGDSVVVESMPFAAAEDVADAPFELTGLVTPEHLLSLARLLIIGIVGLLAIRMLRPKGAEAPTGEAAAGPVHELTPEMRELAARAAQGDEEAMRQLETMNPDQHMPMLDQEIALAQVDGRIKLSTMRRIGATIQESPAESASVIRQWISS